MEMLTQKRNFVLGKNINMNSTSFEILLLQLSHVPGAVQHARGVRAVGGVHGDLHQVQASHGALLQQPGGDAGAGDLAV